MANPGQWKLAVNTLFLYCRQRFPLRFWGTVAWAIWGFSICLRDWLGVGSEIISLIGMTAVMLQWRMWDDLRDADQDRSLFPERIATHVDHRSSLVLAACSLSVPIILSLTTHQIIVYAVSLATIFLIYICGPRIAPHWRKFYLQIKYPLLFTIQVLAAPGGATWSQVVGGFTLIWSLAILFELYDDPELADWSRVSYARRVVTVSIAIHACAYISYFFFALVS